MENFNSTFDKPTQSVAYSLLKNTQNYGLKDLLNSYIQIYTDDSYTSEDFLDEYYISDKRLTSVFKCILKDGYDISQFGLWEIPISDTFCFTNFKFDRKDEVKWFDVYTNWGSKGNTVIGYIAEGGEFEAPSIEEAIIKYEW